MLFLTSQGHILDKFQIFQNRHLKYTQCVQCFINIKYRKKALKIDLRMRSKYSFDLNE